jgi:hypothetical protein
LAHADSIIELLLSLSENAILPDMAIPTKILLDASLFGTPDELHLFPSIQLIIPASVITAN